MKGQIGWAITAATVAAWDLSADETMSSAFARGLRSPGTRVAVAGAWAVLTGHLFGVLPAQLDPLHLAFEATKAARHA